MSKNLIITNAVKREIVEFLRDKVEDSYLSGEIGKELAELRQKIVELAKKEADELYPPEDILILEKYRCCKKISPVRITITDSGEVFVSEFYSKERSVDVFDGIKIPSEHSKTHFPQIFVTKNKELFKTYLKIRNRLYCEIDDIVAAYSDRLKVGFGINRVLKEYPAMLELLPSTIFDDQKTKKKKAPGNTDKLIAAFESSVSSNGADANDK